MDPTEVSVNNRFESFMMRSFVVYWEMKGTIKTMKIMVWALVALEPA